MGLSQNGGYLLGSLTRPTVFGGLYWGTCHIHPVVARSTSLTRDSDGSEAKRAEAGVQEGGGLGFRV